jgi:hypothetical protein
MAFELPTPLSHFSMPDGRSLTEMKTQTEREAVAKGADKSSGAVIKTSRSVLVFAKVPSK